jgi:hypothetical protein
MMKLLTAALFGVLLAGCATPPPPSGAPSLAPNPSLYVSNGTTLTVTLVVNGQKVGDFPPGGPDPTIDVALLPPLPWNVAARSPSGRVLTSMQVAPGEIQGADSAVHTIPMGRVDLSCGRLTIYAGDFAPSGPVPLPSAGSPGDCAP